MAGDYLSRQRVAQKCECRVDTPTLGTQSIYEVYSLGEHFYLLVSIYSALRDGTEEKALKGLVHLWDKENEAIDLPLSPLVSVSAPVVTEELLLGCLEYRVVQSVELMEATGTRALDLPGSTW